VIRAGARKGCVGHGRLTVGTDGRRNSARARHEANAYPPGALKRELPTRGHGTTWRSWSVATPEIPKTMPSSGRVERVDPGPQAD